VLSLRVAALFSGGKDSTLALNRVLNVDYEVKYLVTMIPEREDSWMFHYPNIHMTNLFAEAIGIPLVKAKTSGAKDTELEDLKQLLSQLNIDAVVSGGIASQYQKKSIDKICEELGLKHIAPLWHEEPLKLLEEIIKSKIDVMIIGVYAYGLDQTWLGRKIDRAAIRDLVELNKKYQVSMVGEGGEYETLVLDASFFKKKIQLIETEKVWEGQSGYLFIKKTALANK
jgi:diphthine-ammonia ligase